MVKIKCLETICQKPKECIGELISVDGIPRCPACNVPMADYSNETEYDYRCDCGCRIQGEFEV